MKILKKLVSANKNPAKFLYENEPDGTNNNEVVVAAGVEGDNFELQEFTFSLDGFEIREENKIYLNWKDITEKILGEENVEDDEKLELWDKEIVLDEKGGKKMLFRLTIKNEDNSKNRSFYYSVPLNDKNEPDLDNKVMRKFTSEEESEFDVYGNVLSYNYSKNLPIKLDGKVNLQLFSKELDRREFLKYQSKKVALQENQISLFETKKENEARKVIIFDKKTGKRQHEKALKKNENLVFWNPKDEMFVTELNNEYRLNGLKISLEELNNKFTDGELNIKQLDERHLVGIRRDKSSNQEEIAILNKNGQLSTWYKATEKNLKEGTNFVSFTARNGFILATTYNEYLKNKNIVFGNKNGVLLEKEGIFDEGEWPITSEISPNGKHFIILTTENGFDGIRVIIDGHPVFSVAGNFSNYSIEFLDDENFVIRGTNSYNEEIKEFRGKIPVSIENSADKQVEEYRKKVNKIMDVVNENNLSADDLKQELARLKDLEGQVKRLEKRNEELNKKVDNLTKEKGGLNTKINDLETKNGSLENKLKNVAKILDRFVPKKKGMFGLGNGKEINHYELSPKDLEELKMYLGIKNEKDKKEK